MSRADHDEPLHWHWLYIPLVAYLVFAVGPSVLAPIFFILSLFVDISLNMGPVQQAPGILSILLEPIFLGIIFWPFLWLYGCTRDELIKDPPLLCQQDRPPMTVLIYVNTSKQVGDSDHPKVFANADAAETWFEENDPEGVAFEYLALE
jgi:hypothetical protein